MGPRHESPLVRTEEWPDFAGRLGERSGEEKPASTELGNQRFRVREDAPGRDVLEPEAAMIDGLRLRREPIRSGGGRDGRG